MRESHDPTAPLSEYRVTEAAMRPASKKRRCFYCFEPVGGYHRETCVLIERKVRMSVTIDYETAVPDHWSAEDIDWHRNGSTWCASNVLYELDRQYNNDGGPCLCGHAKFSYIEDVGEPYLSER